MRRLRVLAAMTGAGAAAVAVASNAAAQLQPEGRGATFATVDRYITERMRAVQIPGLTLGIVKDDRILYMKGYGTADSSGRPVTPQTPFVIGSITKSFTALAILQLVDAGKVRLDEPVERYIPWFRTADSALSAQITVRQLLTMTSGLPQVYETQLSTDEDSRALERGVRGLRTKTLSDAPGRAMRYSNAGYETLGQIIQDVSGMSYEDYVKQHVFTPLAMHDAFTSQDEALRHGMAEGHRWWFGVPIGRTLPYNRTELPAGYIIASAEDMTHFLIAEINGGKYGTSSVLSPAGMTLRHSKPSPRGYGYGWEFAEHNGRVLLNHDGGTANFQSAVFIDPVARVGVFIATNADNALDAFSSPPGPSRLDGGTDRAIAATVLSIVANQPRPNQGIGHETLTAIFDLVVAAISIALVVSLARMPRRYRRLRRRGIADRATLLGIVARVSVVHFALPVALLYLYIAVPTWRVIGEFQPDFSYWIAAVAIVLSIKGLVELILAGVVFSKTMRKSRSPSATTASQPGVATTLQRSVTRAP